MIKILRDKKYFRTLVIILNIGFSIVAGIYYTNPVRGFVFGIIYGILISIIFTIVTIFSKFLIGSRGLTGWVFPVIIVSLLAVFMSHKLTWDLSPPEVFKKIFSRKPPGSVKNLRSYCDYPGRNSILRLSFSINKTEPSLIFKNFKVRKQKFDVVVKSGGPNYLASQKLGLLYLRLCDDLSWWDMEHLVTLPQYIWTDENYSRSLWVDDKKSSYEIYLSAISR